MDGDDDYSIQLLIEVREIQWSTILYIAIQCITIQYHITLQHNVIYTVVCSKM